MAHILRRGQPRREEALIAVPVGRHDLQQEIGFARQHGDIHARVRRQAAGLVTLNAGNIDIQPGQRQGDVKDRRGLRMLEQIAGQGFQLRQGSDNRRIGHGTFVNGDQVPRLARLETQFDRRIGFGAAFARVKPDAAARLRRRGQNRMDCRLKSRPAQQHLDHVLFPGAVGRHRPMLEAASAASAEMLAWRRHPIRTGSQHVDQFVPALARSAHPHALIRQAQGHDKATGREAVALKPDLFDKRFEIRHVNLCRTKRDARLRLMAAKATPKAKSIENRPKFGCQTRVVAVLFARP